MPPQLADKWRQDGEVVDGETLWSADEQLLRQLGCSATVARRIVQAVAAVKAAAAGTQVRGRRCVALAVGRVAFAHVCG